MKGTSVKNGVRCNTVSQRQACRRLVTAGAYSNIPQRKGHACTQGYHTQRVLRDTHRVCYMPAAACALTTHSCKPLPSALSTRPQAAHLQRSPLLHEVLPVPPAASGCLPAASVLRSAASLAAQLLTKGRPSPERQNRKPGQQPVSHCKHNWGGVQRWHFAVCERHRGLQGGGPSLAASASSTAASTQMPQG